MSDEELARLVCEWLGIKPPKHVFKARPYSEVLFIYTRDCEYCGYVSSEDVECPCYARVLSDLNEAWKILFSLPKSYSFGIEKYLEERLPELPLYGCHIFRKYETVANEDFSDRKSLCLAIVRAAGKALGIKEE